MFRALYHISFWGFFLLLFLYQNPEANFQDYVSWTIILGVSACVVYANLYLLLPYFFFKKRYLQYVAILLALITAGAIVLVYIPSDNDQLRLPFIQNCVNLFFFLVITSSFKFYREFLRKQALVVKVENQQLKTEISLLKSQVNPHFLFNTLNNLYGLILQNQNQQAADVTLKLSDLMRYLLESSKAERVSLKREVKFVEDYLELEKIRLVHQADIRFEVMGLEDDVSIAPLLFIPIVENVFKHGIKSFAKKNYAYFTLAMQNSEVFFEVQNSIADDVESPPKSETGLANLRKRLELIYPGKYLLVTQRHKDFYKVDLNISLK